jgi:hypothetical protein
MPLVRGEVRNGSTLSERACDRHTALAFPIKSVYLSEGRYLSSDSDGGDSMGDMKVAIMDAAERRVQSSGFYGKRGPSP